MITDDSTDADVIELGKDFIEHFGVKGMHWGIINKKDPSAKPKLSREQKKKAKNEKVAKGYDKIAQTHIDEINRLTKKAETKGRFGKRRINKQISEHVVEKNTAEKAAVAERAGKLTRHQKKIIIGTGAVATAVAAYGTYHLTQSGAMNQMIMKGKAAIQGRGKIPFKKAPALAYQGYSVDEIHHNVVSKINPNYGDIGTKVNCRRATFAYEMRRRGFDVAATRTTNGYGQTISGLHNATSNGEQLPLSKSGSIIRIVNESRNKIVDPSAATVMLDASKHPFGTRIQYVTPKFIMQQLGKMPDGARGELGISWRGGGGHSMAWEIVKGQPVIFDTQTGEVYKKGSRAFRDVVGSMSKVGYTRLDNVDLNYEFLARWLKDAA